MYNFLNSLFGLDLSAQALTFYHFAARALLIYFVGAFIIRVQTQVMTINTPFVFMLNFIMGSALANAIVGNAPYFPVVETALFIVFINWLIELLCFHFYSIRKFFKGEADILIKDGEIIWQNMRKNLVTKEELMEAVRNQTNSNDLFRVKRAYFASSGQISVVTK